MPFFKSNSVFFFVCVALLFTALAVPAFAQTGVVTGKVRDATTAEVLPFANVFINQTTIGTATDAQGNYTLKNVPAGTNEIVFSFVGYKSYQAKIQLKEGESKQLDIRLQADDIQLENVEVKGTRDKEWERQLRKFEKVFLGTTRFAGSCKITNSWVLDFKESDIHGKDIFTATASKPLEIENLALGYRVFYYLKSMVSNAEGHNITGEVRFEEISAPDPKTVKTWNQNRIDAYNGSLRHLVKSIVAGNAPEEGFNLYIDKSGYENTPYRSAVFATQLDKSIQVFPIRNIVTPSMAPDEFTIQFKQRVEIHYTQERAAQKVYSDITYPVSWLQVSGGILRANAKGVLLNSSNVIVSGAMYEARVADLLPYNYSPEQSSLAQVKSTESSLAKKLTRLEEKAYVQTDKSYYYPGETIWFKAYMNYKTPVLMDSLSRVLYIEFIGPENQIIQTKTLALEGGAGDGSFQLPDALETGNYYVRAYTQWMLNYDHEKFFVKSLPVLGLYERPGVVSKRGAMEQTTTQIKLGTEKISYQPREKIDLEFALKDQDGNPLYADLSVSVTDMQQVVNVPEEKNILNSFLFPQEEPNRGSVTEIKYPIEWGITLNGEYKNKKGLPAKASFMMVEGESNRILPIQVDDKGNFTVGNLQFYDTTKMFFQSMGKKKKMEGTVTLQNKGVPSTEKMKANDLFNVVKAESAQRVKLPITISDETAVPEWAGSEARGEIDQLNKDHVPNTYARADFSFSGEDIIKSSRTSLVNALKGRVPGLTIVNGYLRFGGQSNFMGVATTEPLLILDGVQINSGGSDRLNQINPEIVERVDVIKYGGAAIYGTRGSNGVIIVTTKKRGEVSTTDHQSISDFGQVIPVVGYSRPALFTSPDYSKVRDNAIDSDYRSTLYWAPQVVTDKIGNAAFSFYAADSPTRYRIVVEGVSATGEPVRGVFFVDVVK